LRSLDLFPFAAIYVDNLEKTYMQSRDLSRFMWSEALSLLDQADRLHRQFFRPAASRIPTWEPPVDIVETRNHLYVTVALPGVAPETISLARDDDAITVSARKAFTVGAPDGGRGARIHALEIPHGRFERRIPLPGSMFSLTEQRLQDGCLTLIFSRKERA
jgi:HSP20 family molecular chaperone IbpA